MENLRYVVIVAGGSGLRMGTETPKQFLRLKGRPILLHTIDQFLKFDNKIKIILVLPAAHIPTWEQITFEFAINYSIEVVEGGETRYKSVQQGLQVIKNEGVVGIHDGVRPFVSQETIARCYETALSLGNGVPCISINESLREVEGGINRWVNRNKYKIIQTPQCFNTTLIQDAYQIDERMEFTDDASVMEFAGHKINLVEGNPENIKITSKGDLKLGESFIQTIL